MQQEADNLCDNCNQRAQQTHLCPARKSCLCHRHLLCICRPCTSCPFGDRACPPPRCSCRGIKRDDFISIILFIILVVYTTADIKLDPRPEYQRATLRPKIKLGPLPQAISADAIRGPFWFADVTGGQISSRLISLRSATALLVLPGKTAEVPILPKGSIVPAMLIGSL